MISEQDDSLTPDYHKTVSLISLAGSERPTTHTSVKNTKLVVSIALASSVIAGMLNMVTTAAGQTVAKASPQTPMAKPKLHVASARRALADTPTTSLETPISNNESITISAARRAHGTMITLGSAQIQQSVPGTNPLKILARQPGIMFQSSDAQGVDIWSTQIYMHGFIQNQISTTLDDIPLGELTLRNYNGLNPFQAIASENVKRIDVSTGAGAESVASTNNLGGSLEYQSSDPKNQSGGNIEQTFGSYNMYHTFIRFDSGQLNTSGTKLYVSYARNDTNRWKGGGDQFMQQMNTKIVQPIGNDSKITAYFDWSDLHQRSYADYSFDILHHAGYNIDNYYNGNYSGYVTALNVANGIYPSYLNGISDKKDAAYYDATTNTNDYFGYLKGDFKLTNHLRWKTGIYGHAESNAIVWTSPYASSPSGAPVFEQVKQPGIQRFGILSSIDYEISHNRMEAGVWYENNQYNPVMNGYSEPALGKGEPINGVGNFDHLTPFMQLFSQTINTNTFTSYAQDTYNIFQNLAIHFGFKTLLNVSRAGDGYYNTNYYGSGAIAHGTLTTFRAFLPHISGDWHFLKHHELYFDIAENVHAYPQAPFKTAASPFAVTEAAYKYALPTLKPESDWAYAVGYRYSNRHLDATIHAYRVNFFNRLQQITSGPIVNPISTVLNVGGITTNGVDAGVTLRPTNNLSWSNSISYNHSTYNNNINSQGTTYQVKGQQVVAYPQVMYKTALTYEWGQLEARVDASWTSQRNLSYTGDTKIPSYWLSDFGLRYRFIEMGQHISRTKFMKKLEVAFNIYNLSDTRYIATMGENGFPLSGDSQSFLIGMPRTFFGSVKAEF